MTAKKKPAAPVDEPTPDPTPEPAAPVVSVTFDGLRASDTYEDGTVVQRGATFAEQVAQHAPQILQQAIGIVPWAVSGAVETNGGVVTLTLRPA